MAHSEMLCIVDGAPSCCPAVPDSNPASSQCTEDCQSLVRLQPEAMLVQRLASERHQRKHKKKKFRAHKKIRTYRQKKKTIEPADRMPDGKRKGKSCAIAAG